MTTYYAELDSASFPIAFFPDDLFPPNADGSANPAIPLNAVALTENQWIDCINNNGHRQIVNGAPVAYTPPIPASVLPEQITAACASVIVAGFSDRGASVRASMNTWGAAVALSDPSQRSSFDTQCASMLPAMNTWEGAMFAARDAAISNSTPVAQISWPTLPSGAAAFMALCNQG